MNICCNNTVRKDKVQQKSMKLLKDQRSGETKPNKTEIMVLNIIGNGWQRSINLVAKILMPN